MAGSYPRDPYGEYSNPTTRSMQGPQWGGQFNKSGQPRIKGVTALDSARIMHNFQNNGKGPTSQEMGEQAQDQEAARQAKRSLAYQKGYEDYMHKMGYGAQPQAPAPQTPEQKQREQLRLGGLQPGEVDTAISQQKTRPTAPENPAATTKAVANAPQPAKAPAPPAQPATPNPPKPDQPSQSTMTDENGKQVPMSDWIASNKARQNGGSGIGLQGGDKAAIGTPQKPGPSIQHVAEIQATNNSASGGPSAGPAPAPATPAASPSALTSDQIDAMGKKYANIRAQMQSAQSDEGAPASAPAASPAPTFALTDTQKANGASVTPAPADADEEPTPRAKGGRVRSTMNKMVPTPRADGGIVNAFKAIGGTAQEPGAPRVAPVQAATTMGTGGWAPRPTTWTPRPQGAGGPAIAMKKGGKVKGIMQKMRDTMMPTPRAKGGPVKMAAAKSPQAGTPESMSMDDVSAPASQSLFQPMAAPMKPVARKAGGNAGHGPLYKVGDAGSPQAPAPELFMPDDNSAQPEVVGQDGPQTGTFQKSGTIVPNHALKQLKTKFSQQKSDNGQGPPPLPAKGGKISQLGAMMRPKAA